MPDQLPPMVVSKEVQLIAEVMGLSYSEVYDEMDRLYKEAVLRVLQPLTEALVKQRIQQYKEHTHEPARSPA